MQEADLARPVVEVSDFMTNNLKYEIYTFGQQIACIALEDDTSMRVDQETFKAAMSNLENEIRRAAPGAQFTVDLLEGNKVMIYIDRHSAKAIIGKRGQKIRKIERKTGLSIMVESIETIGGFE